MVKSRDFDTHNNNEVKKECVEESKEAAADNGNEEDSPVLLATHVNNISLSNFHQSLVVHQQSANTQMHWTLCVQFLVFNNFDRVIVE